MLANRDAVLAPVERSLSDKLATHLNRKREKCRGALRCTVSCAIPPPASTRAVWLGTTGCRAAARAPLCTALRPPIARKRCSSGDGVAAVNPSVHCGGSAAGACGRVSLALMHVFRYGGAQQPMFTADWLQRPLYFSVDLAAPALPAALNLNLLVRHDFRGCE